MSFFFAQYLSVKNLFCRCRSGPRWFHQWLWTHRSPERDWPSAARLQDQRYDQETGSRWRQQDQLQWVPCGKPSYVVNPSMERPSRVALWKSSINLWLCPTLVTHTPHSTSWKNFLSFIVIVCGTIIVLCLLVVSHFFFSLSIKWQNGSRNRGWNMTCSINDWQFKRGTLAINYYNAAIYG